jgi:hypothetical protein
VGSRRRRPWLEAWDAARDELLPCCDAAICCWRYLDSLELRPSSETGMADMCTLYKGHGRNAPGAVRRTNPASNCYLAAVVEQRYECPAECWRFGLRECDTSMDEMPRVGALTPEKQPPPPPSCPQLYLAFLLLAGCSPTALLMRFRPAAARHSLMDRASQFAWRRSLNTLPSAGRTAT